MHSGIDWSDLQYVLAVARHRTFAGAARALRVSHTTVLRRIGAFEAAHGVRLFDRVSSGYALTAGGEELLAAAQSVADVVTALERRLAGQDLRLEGLVRVTTLDTLMVSLLPPILAGFQAEHPAVRIELGTSATIANLARREADVAIRVSADPPDTLIGRRIAPVAMAIYQARDAGPPPAKKDWEAHRWIAPSASLSDTAIAQWMRKRLGHGKIVVEADSIVSMASAAASGIGLAALPCYLGDAMPALRRASTIMGSSEAPNHVWVLSHRDLRHTARVRAFTEYVSQALTLVRDAFVGGAERPT